MNIYFDTEFTGLHKGTTLISIGLVSEDGKIFYGEITDYDKSQVNDWIKENVIDHLKFTSITSDTTSHTNTTSIACGSKEYVGNHLNRWLNEFKSVQLISDCCHYDMVLLIDLISKTGDAFGLPSNISPVCHDICQDIAYRLKISDKAAFDYDREEIVRKIIDINPPVGDRHNSLYDAKVIKIIYEWCR